MLRQQESTSVRTRTDVGLRVPGLSPRELSISLREQGISAEDHARQLKALRDELDNLAGSDRIVALETIRPTSPLLQLGEAIGFRTVVAHRVGDFTSDSEEETPTRLPSLLYDAERKVLMTDAHALPLINSAPRVQYGLLQWIQAIQTGDQETAGAAAQGLGVMLAERLLSFNEPLRTIPITDQFLGLYVQRSKVVAPEQILTLAGSSPAQGQVSEGGRSILEAPGTSERAVIEARREYLCSRLGLLAKPSMIVEKNSAALVRYDFGSHSFTIDQSLFKLDQEDFKALVDFGLALMERSAQKVHPEQSVRRASALIDIAESMAPDLGALKGLKKPFTILAKCGWETTAWSQFLVHMIHFEGEKFRRSPFKVRLITSRILGSSRDLYSETTLLQELASGLTAQGAQECKALLDRRLWVAALTAYPSVDADDIAQTIKRSRPLIRAVRPPERSVDDLFWPQILGVPVTVWGLLLATTWGQLKSLTSSDPQKIIRSSLKGVAPYALAEETEPLASVASGLRLCAGDDAFAGLQGVGLPIRTSIALDIEANRDRLGIQAGDGRFFASKVEENWVGVIGAVDGAGLHASGSYGASLEIHALLAGLRATHVSAPEISARRIERMLTNIVDRFAVSLPLVNLPTTQLTARAALEFRSERLFERLSRSWASMQALAESKMLSADVFERFADSALWVYQQCGRKGPEAVANYATRRCLEYVARDPERKDATSKHDQIRFEAAFSYLDSGNYGRRIAQVAQRWAESLAPDRPIPLALLAKMQPSLEGSGRRDTLLKLFTVLLENGANGAERGIDAAATALSRFKPATRQAMFTELFQDAAFLKRVLLRVSPALKELILRDVPMSLLRGALEDSDIDRVRDSLSGLSAVKVAESSQAVEDPVTRRAVLHREVYFRALPPHEVVTDLATGEEIPNHYAILGVPRSASLEELKRSYRLLSFVFHPDRLRLESAEGKRDGEASFKQVGEAYEVLHDADTRLEYDRRLPNDQAFYPKKLWYDGLVDLPAV